MFLHETWCAPRQFPGLLKPVGLMASHLPTVRERVLARYPFLHSSAFERRMLFQHPAKHGAVPTLISTFQRATIVPQS